MNFFSYCLFLAQRGAICNIPCRGDIDEALRLKPLGDVGKVRFHLHISPSTRSTVFPTTLRTSSPLLMPSATATSSSTASASTIRPSSCCPAGSTTRMSPSSWSHRTSYQDVNVFWPERLAKVCKEMGVKNLIHIGALQSNPKHNSEWARAKVHPPPSLSIT